jgi:hypothetical protein
MCLLSIKRVLWMKVLYLAKSLALWSRDSPAA